MYGRKKLELEDFPKSAVVNSSIYFKNSEADQLINKMVINHISKIVDLNLLEEAEAYGTSLIYKSETDEFKPENVEINGLEDDKEAAIPSDNEILDASGPDEIDIEKIKQDFYNQGFEEARQKYEQIIEKFKQDNNFLKLFQEKLSSIVNCDGVDDQISKIFNETFDQIKNFCLKLPRDFESAVKYGLFDKFEKSYKNGDVTLTIHPERYDFCNEILQSAIISDKNKVSFNIVQDNNLDVNDCTLEWDDTRLSYSQSKIFEKINELIKTTFR